MHWSLNRCLENDKRREKTENGRGKEIERKIETDLRGRGEDGVIEREERYSALPLSEQPTVVNTASYLATQDHLLRRRSPSDPAPSLSATARLRRDTSVSHFRMNGNKTLHQIADAFKDLANAVADSQTAKVKVAPFSQACSLISPLFGSLGIGFRFAEKDYVAKVNDLAEASESIQTLHSSIDRDVQGRCRCSKIVSIALYSSQ